MNVILLGNMICANVIRVLTIILDLGGQHLTTGNLIREMKGRFNIVKEKGHVKMNAEVRVMQPQAKECQEMLAVIRSWERDMRGFSLRASRRNQLS